MFLSLSEQLVQCEKNIHLMYNHEYTEITVLFDIPFPPLLVTADSEMVCFLKLNHVQQPGKIKEQKQQ